MSAQLVHPKSHTTWNHVLIKHVWDRNETDWISGRLTDRTAKRPTERGKADWLSFAFCALLFWWDSSMSVNYQRVTSFKFQVPNKIFPLEFPFWSLISAALISKLHNANFFSLFLGSQPKPSHRPEVETCYESSSILNTCTHSNSAQKNFLRWDAL